MMDYGSNAIEIIPNTTAHEPLWATDDDYPNPNSDQPPNNKKLRSESNTNSPVSISVSNSSNSLSSSVSKSRAIGKMFFKTKLCCKFRAGTCPYINNCNFAHGMEELRKPPPNWQEIVAAAQSENSMNPLVSPDPPLREEHSIPILTSSNVGAEGNRNYKGRHCKKFYTEEGCPYGETCTFLHDEQSKARESVAISLSPSVGAGLAGGAAGGGGAGAGAGVGPAGQKPSNWKTRICNKWEMTGYCPFGSKCHFAHGAAELHKYGGGLVETDSKEAQTPDSKQSGGVSAKSGGESTAVQSSMPVPHLDLFHIGAPAQRPPIVSQRPVSAGPTQRLSAQKWRGPDKISRIYGDWIDEYE